MSRRTLIRPPPREEPDALQRSRRRQKLQTCLEQERTALARWQSRLKRAFNACQKHQARIARYEKQLARLEE